MNREEQERLLADALADDAPAGFREQLRNVTVHRARNRRRWRQTRRGAGALIVLALVIFVIRSSRHAPTTEIPAAVASCEIIQTRPLPADAIVTSVPLSPGQVVTTSGRVTLIETESAIAGVHELDDQQLLALVAPRPAALVGCGPQCERLVFVHPDDANGFPVN